MSTVPRRLRGATEIMAIVIAGSAMGQVSYEQLVTDDDPLPIPGYRIDITQACFDEGAILIGAIPTDASEGQSALLRVNTDSGDINVVINPGAALPHPPSAAVDVLTAPQTYGHFIAFRNRPAGAPAHQSRLYLLDSDSGQITHIGQCATRKFSFGDGRLFWCTSSTLYAFNLTSGVNEVIANTDTIVPGTLETLGGMMNNSTSLTSDEHSVAFIADFGDGDLGLFCREHASGELHMVASRSTSIPDAPTALFETFPAVATCNGAVTCVGTGEEKGGAVVGGVYQWNSDPMTTVAALHESDPRGYLFHEFQSGLWINESWHIYTAKMMTPDGATTQNAWYAERREDERLFFLCQEQNWGIKELGREADECGVLDLRDNHVLFYTVFEDSLGTLGSLYVATVPASDGSPDLTGDGQVNALDLLQLLGAWGKCDGCLEDLNLDGQVDVIDLLMLVSNWSS